MCGYPNVGETAPEELPAQVVTAEPAINKEIQNHEPIIDNHSDDDMENYESFGDSDSSSSTAEELGIRRGPGRPTLI